MTSSSEGKRLPTPRFRWDSDFINRTAPALRARDFRIFWFGQLLSVTGTSLQVVAEGYLIYQLTGSTFWLGMVGLLALIPVLPISIVGGVLIDRVPRRKLIMATQAALLLQALAFGLLAMSGRLQLWHIVLLYFIFGAILAIDHPARRAFLVELVDEEDLANAVALNATIFNFSSLVGYALAGLLIAMVGAGTAILLNSLTYLAPLIALGFIRVKDVVADPRSRNEPGPPFREVILEGATVLWKQPAILGTISLMAIIGGLAWPVFGMMPAYAEEVVQVGAMGLGLLMSMGALGSILGTILVARMGRRRRGHTLTIAAIVLPSLVIGFAYTRSVTVAAILLIGIGATLLVVQSLAITLVQVNIPDRVRGRVMTIYSILHAGSDTMGNVAVGSLAVVLSLPVSLGLAGLVALVYAFGLRRFMPGVDDLD